MSEFNFFGLDFMHYTIFNMGRVPDPVYVRWTLQGNVALCSTSEVALASTKQCLSYSSSLMYESKVLDSCLRQVLKDTGGRSLFTTASNASNFLKTTHRT